MFDAKLGLVVEAGPRSAGLVRLEGSGPGGCRARSETWDGGCVCGPNLAKFSSILLIIRVAPRTGRNGSGML